MRLGSFGLNRQSGRQATSVSEKKNATNVIRGLSRNGGIIISCQLMPWVHSIRNYHNAFVDKKSPKPRTTITKNLDLLFDNYHITLL